MRECLIHSGISRDQLFHRLKLFNLTADPIERKSQVASFHSLGFWNPPFVWQRCPSSAESFLARITAFPSLTSHKFYPNVSNVPLRRLSITNSVPLVDFARALRPLRAAFAARLSADVEKPLFEDRRLAALALEAALRDPLTEATLHAIAPAEEERLLLVRGKHDFAHFGSTADGRGAACAVRKTVIPEYEVGTSDARQRTH
jgi:hypothetical protein